jgi:hypothetical protein
MSASAKSGLMQRSKVEEIQGVQRSLSVNLSPCAHAVRSTRRTPTDFKSVFPVFRDDQVHVRAL